MRGALRARRAGAPRLLPRRLPKLRGYRPVRDRGRWQGEHDLVAGEVDFYRLLPPGGYTKGLPAALRTDVGEGDIPPETRGKDFFPYKPRHLGVSPPRPALARATNMAQRVMSSGKYDGAIFTQGSPAVEETAYWFNLLIDTT